VVTVEIYVPEAVAQDIIAISKSFNVDAQIVGRVEAADGKKLTISSEYGTLNINVSFLIEANPLYALSLCKN
jgi:hydrogenase maturation factor HypE